MIGQTTFGVFIGVHQRRVARFLRVVAGLFEHLGEAARIVAVAELSVDLRVAAFAVKRRGNSP